MRLQWGTPSHGGAPGGGAVGRAGRAASRPQALLVAMGLELVPLRREAKMNPAL